MARTTLDLDPTVLRELKARGAAERRSMGEVASELLAVALRETEEPASEPPAFKWKTWDGGEPLIDLDDKDALWRVLDER